MLMVSICEHIAQLRRCTISETGTFDSDSGTNYFLFANNFAEAKLPRNQAPTEFLDYLKPQFKGKIVSTYPNDDDAVLFQ